MAFPRKMKLSFFKNPKLSPKVEFALICVALPLSISVGLTINAALHVHHQGDDCTSTHVDPFSESPMWLNEKVEARVAKEGHKAEGSGAKAVGDNSVAMGPWAVVKGEQALSIGPGAKAKGKCAEAYGPGATAIGPKASAGGEGSKVNP